MLDAKRKAMIFLAVAFIFALLAATLLLNEIRNAQASLGETIQVAVAKEDIEAYTPLDESMITWESIPATTEISSYVRDGQELEDTINIVPVSKGDLITKNMIRSTVDIPSDHRIVWLNATDNVIMDQAVAEGDKVDIIVSYRHDRANIRTVRMFDGVDVVQRNEPEEGDDGEASIKVSLAIEEAEELIHYQNTADQIRVLIANQAEEINEAEKEETGRAEKEDERKEDKEKSSRNEREERDDKERRHHDRDERDDKDDKENAKEKSRDDEKDEN